MGITHYIGIFFLIHAALVTSGCVGEILDPSGSEGRPVAIVPRWEGAFPEEAMQISKEEFARLENQGDIRVIDSNMYQGHLALTAAPEAPTEDKLDEKTEIQVKRLVERSALTPIARQQLERLIARHQDKIPLPPARLIPRSVHL